MWVLHLGQRKHRAFRHIAVESNWQVGPAVAILSSMDVNIALLDYFLEKETADQLA